MGAWTDFFLGEVGAAAALAGLLVVAVTINIEKIMSFPLLPGRAAHTVVIIGGALMILSFALFPGATPVAVRLRVPGRRPSRRNPRSAADRAGVERAARRLPLHLDHDAVPAGRHLRHSTHYGRCLAGCGKRSRAILDCHRGHSQPRRDTDERLGTDDRNLTLGLDDVRHPRSHRNL
jgi:hypothetical protein